MKKVENQNDFIKNAWYSSKKSSNKWQLMWWDNEFVALWSNNLRVTRKFKIESFIKNWFLLQ